TKDIGLVATLLVLTLVLFPRVLVSYETAGVTRSDISTPGLSVWTFQVALVLSSAILWKHSKPIIPVPFVLGAIAAAALLTVWEMNLTVLSGYAHLLTAMMAWVVGTQLSQCLGRDRQEAL